MSWGPVVEAAPWTVVGGIALWWLRERRKDRAASEVAERTVGADVAVKDVGAAEARLVFAERAFDSERASYDRRIAELETENARLRTDVEHRDEVITRLRAQAAELEERLGQMTRQLTAMRKEMDELTADSKEG